MLHVKTVSNSVDGKKVNQDRVLVFSSEDSALAVVAIFDGHGKDGHSVASFVRQAFLTTFLHPSVPAAACVQERAVDAIEKAETELIHCDEIDSKRSGCTANIGLICRDPSGTLCFYSVHVGDSEWD